MNITKPERNVGPSSGMVRPIELVKKRGGLVGAGLSCVDASVTANILASSKAKSLRGMAGLMKVVAAVAGGNANH